MRQAQDRSAFYGRWRIIDSELWDREALDLIVPAHITFGDEGLGTMELIAIGASIDYRVSLRTAQAYVEFSWCGEDDGDFACGRGWAVRKGDTLEGKLFIHQGDESGFAAERDSG